MKTDATDTRDDLQSLARAHSADAIAVLAEIMNNTDAPAGARLSAAKALLDRGWGKAGAKPPDDGNRATPGSQIKRVIVDPRHGEERSAGGGRNGPVELGPTGLPVKSVQWTDLRTERPKRKRRAERRTPRAWASGRSDFAAAGLSRNLERGRLSFSYERSELEKLTALRAERRAVPASRRAFNCAASIRCRYGLFAAFAGPVHLLMRLRRAAPPPAPRAPPAATSIRLKSEKFRRKRVRVRI